MRKNKSKLQGLGVLLSGGAAAMTGVWYARCAEDTSDKMLSASWLVLAAVILVLGAYAAGPTDLGRRDGGGEE